MARMTQGGYMQPLPSSCIYNLKVFVKVNKSCVPPTYTINLNKTFLLIYEIIFLQTKETWGVYTTFAKHELKKRRVKHRAIYLPIIRKFFVFLWILA